MIRIAQSGRSHGAPLRRRVLAQGSAEVRIETLPRRGYRLLGTVTAEAGAQGSKGIEPQIAGEPPITGRQADEGSE